MQWYEFLGYGTLGGLICGGFFFALGTWLDHRQAKRWRRDLEEVSKTAPLTAETMRASAVDMAAVARVLRKTRSKGTGDGA